MNVSDGIEWGSAHLPDKVAVVADDGTRITYRELDESANRIASFLVDDYVMQPGDRVGILAGNTIQFLEAFYGIIRARCVAVPLNDQWSGEELDAYLSNCQPALILARSGTSLRFEHWMPVVELGLGNRVDSLFSTWDPIPLPEKPDRDDLFYIGYTSGSTGSPKGVLRRHGSWLDSYEAATVEFGCERDDRVLTPGSLFYSLSLFAVTHALFLGSTVHIISGFDPRKTLEVVEQERVTTLCMTPTLYEAILNARGTSKRDLSSARTLICAGSSWPRAAEAKEELLSLFPSAGLYEYYGATETSFVSVSPPEHQMTRPRSAGRPFLGVQVEIRDEGGMPLGSGEVGTLYARSSYGFEGYYGDPERTAAVLRDGWMTVGDLAYADDEGNLYIVGRKDNVVITGGMNVSVEEVEEVLNSHPQVSLAAVFGAEDSRRGQILVALVQAREGAELSSRELRAYCAGKLDPHKAPRKIKVVDAIPLTTSGKISRPDLARTFSKSSPIGARSRR